MVEYWNIVIPFKTHDSTIPLFHHSILPLFPSDFFPLLPLFLREAKDSSWQEEDNQ
jgi:hypothetical protein